MIVIKKESTDDSQEQEQEYKTLTLKARDYDNNLENLLNCIKDLSTAGHSFTVVVDPGEEGEKDRTFGIDGDGCDQLMDIEVSTSNDSLKTESKPLILNEEGEEEEEENDQIASNVAQANAESNSNLESNNYTSQELTDGIKFLIDDEKEAIEGYNKFLSDFSSKVPNEVYDIIEKQLDEIKDDEMDHQKKLEKLFTALSSSAINNVEEISESINDLAIEDVAKLFNKLKAKGLSEEEIIKEIEKLSEKEPKIIHEDQNSIEVILSQDLYFEYSTDIEKYEDADEFVLDSLEIDDTKIAEELLKYFKSYNYNDEFRDIYNLVNRVNVDFEGTSIKVYLTINDTTVTDERLKYVFDDFIKDVVLEDDQLNGHQEISVEPFESEPYEVGYDYSSDRIKYGTSVIDSIEVDYSFSTIGEQKLEIER